MGDWAITDHYIIGAHRPAKPRWSDDRWAMRIGHLGPGLQLMQTLQKYGLQPLGGEGVLTVSAVYDHLSGQPTDSFFVGCNYLLAPPTDASLFEATAASLGEGAAVVSRAPGQLLCLRQPLRHERAWWTWDPNAEVASDPMGAFVRLLVRSEQWRLTGRTSRFITGLWTAAHGYVHTGHLDLRLDSQWSPEGEWVATAAHNPFQAKWSGPYAGSIYVTSDDRPSALPAVPWPFLR